MDSTVLIEKREYIALVTLNRPERLNALDYPSVDRLLDILDEIEPDDAIRAVILPGTGDRASVPERTFRPSSRASGRDRKRRCGSSCGAAIV
jgi:1,4-dihydroxy-2-naphthoyl-CoA synthase